jgi:hypothetical protein
MRPRNVITSRSSPVPTLANIALKNATFASGDDAACTIPWWRVEEPGLGPTWRHGFPPGQLKQPQQPAVFLPTGLQAARSVRPDPHGRHHSNSR